MPLFTHFETLQEKAPRGFREISIVAIISNGRVLLVRRTATAPSYALHWTFPGGGIDPGETPKQAAVREIKEEVNLDLNPSKLKELGVEHHDSYKVNVFEYHMHDAKPRLLDGEHDRYTWIRPYEAVCYILHPRLDSLISKLPLGENHE